MLDLYLRKTETYLTQCVEVGAKVYPIPNHGVDPPLCNLFDEANMVVQIHCYHPRLLAGKGSSW